jgi:LysM repeat protein
MKKRTSFLARILAALALVAAVAAVVVIVSSASKESSSGKGHKSAGTTKQEPKKQRTKAATYTVKPGDTLIAIAHKTGIPVSEIQALNPEVDPQILIAGETLKLK